MNFVEKSVNPFLQLFNCNKKSDTFTSGRYKILQGDPEDNV